MSVPKMSASGHAQRRYVRNDPVASVLTRNSTEFILEQGARASINPQKASEIFLQWNCWILKKKTPY